MEKLLVTDSGITAIITKHNPPCKEGEHNWNGPSIYITASGKIVTIGTHLKWAGYTNHFRGQLIMEHYESIDDPIISGQCSCLKCKIGYLEGNNPFMSEI